MALTKIQSNDLAPSLATTIAQGGGPKISNVQIANSSWSQLDDTAISLDGGYILINGSGFSNGVQVLINNITATSVSVVNSSVIRAQVPSANAGTYVAYVVNSDGGTAIGVNALTYSATPSWVTSSTLNSQLVDVAISIQLEASNATSYALQAGSSLPANTTLASNGLFSGTVTGIEVDTSYSFTVVATDDENQDSPRTFSVTVTAIVTDEYFNSTALLLLADGTSNTTQNHTFIGYSYGVVPDSAEIIYAKSYNVYSGGSRGANYTVYYSDDGITWTTAFTGVMASTTSCGLITGTGGGTSSGGHKYWKYVVGSSTDNHHPRVSRIVLSDGTTDYNIVVFNGDNCADTGTIPTEGNVYYSGVVPITRNSNITQGTFSPFSPTGWSAYFDGSGDYLTVPSNTAFDFGTGDYTVECWFQRANGGDSSAQNIIEMRGLSGSGSGIRIHFVNTLSTFAVGYGSSDTQITTTMPGIGTWNHVAVTRSGTTVKFFVNGTSVGTATDSTNIDSNDVVIGTYASGTSNFAGYISNVRIVKGTSLYTSNFTPATSPLTAVSGTSLLTLQSNRFVDNSTNTFTVTRYGSARITAFSPFKPAEAWSAATHGGSGYLDGDGDQLTLASNSLLNFGAGDFTIESWVYYPTDTNSEASFISNQGSFGSGSIRIGLSSGSLRLYLNGTGDIVYDPASDPFYNAWTHWAVVRSGNTFKLYKNGTNVSTGTYSGSIDFSLNGTTIGGNWSSSGYMKGYISSWRAVKGTAVYTSNFTPPTAPPTAIANTSLLLNFTNAGIYDATAKNVLETVGNAQVRTDVKKYGTGSMYFDGTGDYLLTSSVPLLNLGLGSFTWECWLYPNTVSGIKGIYATTGGSGSVPKFVVHLDGSTIKIHYNGLTGGSNIYTSSTGSISASQWTHVAFVRDGSNWTWYINGIAAGTGTNSADLTFTTQPTYIGYGGEDYFAAFNGYIDDLRITKGVARYTSNFTVPDKAFPAR